MLDNIEFKEIELCDKPIFDDYLSRNCYENSEFTFTNLFIWRHYYQLKYAILEDNICMIGRYRKKFPMFFPPLGDNSGMEKALIKVIEYYKKHNYPIIMKGVTDSIREEIEKAMPGKFNFKPDPNNFDYVYLSEDLIHLKGRKYQKKRNHINKFKSRYSYSYEPVNGDNIEECIIAELEWAAERRKNRGIQEEKAAIIEALRNFEALGIKGGALRIEGKVQAFALGELLNPEMAVVHFEKANVNYHGSYAMINQRFTQNCWSHVKYINREEDMGLPGLRKAKKSYHPVKMVKKYTARLS